MGIGLVFATLSFFFNYTVLPYPNCRGTTYIVVSILASLDSYPFLQ